MNLLMPGRTYVNLPTKVFGRNCNQRKSLKVSLLW
jgi:hypothetical protein